MEHNEDAPNAADLAQIEDAFRRVPRMQRAIFFAVRFDKLSYTEIAERTGLTTTQVERQLAKALMNYTRNLANPHRHWWRRHWPL